VSTTAVGGAGGFPSYRWVSPVRAAQILGVPVADVYKLIDGGRLPGYRIADEVKLLAHDIEALLDDGGDDRPG
jgi:hypothetical protein